MEIFFRNLCVSFQIIIKPAKRSNISIRQHFMLTVSISTFFQGGRRGELGIGESREHQENSNV
jgi:hypothetical protein